MESQEPAIEEKLAALPFVHRGRTKFLERYNTFGQTVQMDGQDAS